MKKLLVLFFGISLLGCADDESEVNMDLSGSVVSLVRESSSILSAESSLEEVLNSDAVVITPDNQTYFAIGYRQVSSNNQNPILLRYDNGSLTWARTDYETSGDDGTGRGLILDPERNLLYAVFTSTGTQGDANADYRRFCSNGWLTSYGQGGGAKVVVLAQIDPNNGDPLSGTFVTAQLSNGNANTVQATGLSLVSNGVQLEANSFFSPRKIDKSTFSCEGSSPFRYTISFDLELQNAIEASAIGCQ